MRPAIVLALALPTARAVAVTRLDEANFEGQVKKGELWLVAFVAPWCGHCKQLAPVLDEVAESIDSAARSAPPVRVGAIDCSSNRAFCDTRRVKGFPTVRLMHEDRTWEHKGARSKAALLEAVARLRRPAVFELGGISKLDALHRSARVVFYLGRTGHREHESDAAMRAGFAEAARERQLSDNFASGGRKLTAHLLALANHKPPVRADGSPAALVVLRLEAGEAARVLELPPGDAGEDDGAPAGAPGVASAGVAAAHSPTGARNGMHRRAIDAFVSAHREPLLSLIDADNLVRLSSLDKPLVILVVDPQSIRAPMEGARPLGLDDFADGARGLGPAIRALSRDAALYDRYLFAILDGAAYNATLSSTYAIPLVSLPRMMVLRHGGKGRSRSFAASRPIDRLDEGGEGAMRAFLAAVDQRTVRFEDEGGWGWRWRTAKRYVPALSYLDWMPNYSIAVLLAVCVAGLAYQIVTYLNLRLEEEADVYPHSFAALKKAAGREGDGSNGAASADFRVQFDVRTTRGDETFVVRVRADWSARGAQHFRELVGAGFYDDTRFYRVIPTFMVQFGLSGDSAVNAAAMRSPIRDESPRVSNQRGYVTFAQASQPHSRTSQIFINLVDNAQLDTMGFAPFGEVEGDGLNVVSRVHNCGEEPNQGKIMRQGNAYLDAQFPQLSKIVRATLIEESKAKSKDD